MRSFRDFNPYVVGVVSVALIASAVAGALAVGLLRILEDTYTVEAVFADAAGARNGDEVRVAGVQVGRISKIEPDRRQGTVVITLEVDKGIDLSPDTTAELALTTLLGTKFVRLDGQVPATGPYLADVPEDERVIPLERTKIPFDIFELTTTATRNIESTDNEKLNQLIVSLADITEGNAGEIGQLIQGIDTVSSALAARDDELRSLLREADDLSAILAEKDQTLVELIDQSQGILGLLARRQGDVGRALRTGGQMAGELARVVNTHKTFLDALLDTLHPTIDIVDRRMGELDRALAWLGPGGYGLSLAVNQGTWADIYVRALGPDFIGVLEELAEQEGAP